MIMLTGLIRQLPLESEITKGDIDRNDINEICWDCG